VKIIPATNKHTLVTLTDEAMKSHKVIAQNVVVHGCPLHEILSIEVVIL